MKKIFALLLTGLLIGCSTSGGIYSKGDPQHGEFSVGRTVLTILGVAAGVAAARHGGGGGGGGGGQDSFAWDYQPGNGQWACRNKRNGEYAYLHECDGVAKYDAWP